MPKRKPPPPKTRNGKNANLVRHHAFTKGTPKPPDAGRKKGTHNRTTTLLKEAILEAATLLGDNGKGRDGLVGYLKMLATRERAVYARLLEKVLPLQVHVEDKTTPIYSAAEAVAKLRERGLPVPHSLLALAGPAETASTVAGALNDQYEDGETDDLDNRLADTVLVSRFVHNDEFDKDADEDDENSSRDK
jgi:hypothetical protein